MLTRISLAALSLALLAAPTIAQEAAPETIACEGVYGPDSSEALVIETFGAENVVTGIVPGPEGMEMLATTVFPDDPQKKMQFGWWDEKNLTQLSYVEIAPSQTAPGGMRIGLNVAELEALNGAPYNISGFWWDYGGSAWFQEGAFVWPEKGCGVSARFDTDVEIPEGLDVLAISGDVTVPSSEPLLEQLDFRVIDVTIGYPWPEGLPQPDYED